MITTATDRVAIGFVQDALSRGLSMNLSPIIARMWREMMGDCVEMIEEAPQGGGGATPE